MDQEERHESYQIVIEKPVKTEPTTTVELDTRKPKEKLKPSAQKKVLSVIESDPFQTLPLKRYMMLTEQERLDIKQGNPELNVRVADKDETMENLCIRDEAMEEDSEYSKNDNRELNMQERLHHYRLAMEWIREMVYKAWVFRNQELLMMPDGKMLRWYWGDTPIPEED